MTSLRQQVMRRRLQQFVARLTTVRNQVPGWRHPLAGYLAGLLLVGVGLGIGLVETRLLSSLFFPGVLLLFSASVVALVWGVGPAVFAILLSLLFLDYLYAPPFDVLGGNGWSGLLQLLTFAAAGGIIAVLANQRERTQQRALAAEQEARRRASQLEATFEAMSDGVIVYHKQGHVLQANKAAHGLFDLGALPSESKAATRQALLHQVVQCDEGGQMLPEQRRPLTRLLRGEVLTGSKSIDTLLRTPDGREVVLNISGAPIREHERTIERAVVICRDVTERRRLERQTAEALQALVAMAEALVQFPQHADAEAFPETARVCQRLVELTRGVVTSAHVTMLTVEPEEERLCPIASVGFTIQEKKLWCEQLEASPDLIDYLGYSHLIVHLRNDETLVLDGMSLPVHTQILPYYVRTVLVAPICTGNDLIGILCVDDGSHEHTYTRHEISLIHTIARLAALILERERLQRQHVEAQTKELLLRAANIHLQACIDLISHELQTPLTVIKGNIHLAEEKVKRMIDAEMPEAGATRHFAPVLALLESARGQASIQSHLVKDLLDISRVQTGTLKLLIIPCNLVSIVQEAVEERRRAAPSRVIHLSLPDNGIVVIHADAERIGQVVTHYLANALKYSSPGQPVEVSLAAKGLMACVSVRDEGPGLPSTEQQLIWQCFYRTPGIGTQDGSSGGLGMGLFICRSIIERHRGQVGVQSEPERGSTFWFTLPCITSELETGNAGESN
jgi:signal transduction histidine kinase/PAS domain-containing protein